MGSRASSGILSFWEPRAKREPCRRGVSVGERGSKPPGSPAIASAKRWKSVASPKVSVGDTQVCGRGAPETDSRAVAAEGEADSEWSSDVCFFRSRSWWGGSVTGGGGRRVVGPEVVVGFYMVGTGAPRHDNQRQSERAACPVDYIGGAN